MNRLQKQSFNVSVILDDIKGEVGELYLEHFGHWHYKLSLEYEPSQRYEACLQLASLALEAEEVGERELAITFADLAAIDLGRSKRTRSIREVGD